MSANELSSIVMDASVGSWISGKPSISEYVSYVVASLVINPDDLHEISHWINAGECLEFKVFAVDVDLPRANKVYGNFIPRSEACLSWLHVAILSSLSFVLMAVCWADILCA